MARRRRVNITGPVDEPAQPAPDDIEAQDAADPVPPIDAVEPPPVLPTRADLRATYDALATEVKTLKIGSEAHRVAMEAKRQAFIAWNTSEHA